MSTPGALVSLKEQHAIMLYYNQIDLKIFFSMIYFLLKSDRYVQNYGFQDFWVAQNNLRLLWKYYFPILYEA